MEMSEARATHLLGLQWFAMGCEKKIGGKYPTFYFVLMFLYNDPLLL